MYTQIDAIEGLKSLDKLSVDLILTDPPYWTLEKWRDMGTTTRLSNSKASSNQWFETQERGYFPAFFEECYRVLKNHSDFYVFCDPETQRAIEPMIEAAGFKLRKPIVWRKTGKEKVLRCSGCRVPHSAVQKTSMGMGYPYRASYEMVIFAQKGKRKPTGSRAVRDVLEYPSVDTVQVQELIQNILSQDISDEARVLVDLLGQHLEGADLPDILPGTWVKSRTAYPTEKPVDLLEVLVGQSSNEGDLVLDPFAGSGSALVAAQNKGRRWIGFDLSGSALNYFKRRTKGEVSQAPYKDPFPVSDFLQGFLSPD